MRIKILYIRSMLSETELVITESKLVFIIHFMFYSVQKSPLIDLSCFKSYTFRTLSISNVFAYTGINHIITLLL